MKKYLVILLFPFLTGCSALTSMVTPTPTVDTTFAAVQVGQVQNQVLGLIQQGCSPDSQAKLQQAQGYLQQVSALLVAAPKTVDTTAVIVALSNAQVITNALVAVACSPEFSNNLISIGNGIQALISQFK